MTDAYTVQAYDFEPKLKELERAMKTGERQPGETLPE